MPPLFAPRDASFGAALDVRLDLPVARAGSRALALFLDWLLLACVHTALGGLFLLAATGAAFVSPSFDTVAWAFGLYLLAAWVLECAWFTTWEIVWAGQTPGKRVVGLRVVAEDGTAAPNRALLVRNLLRPVDSLPGGYVLGLVMILLDPRARRVGDLAAGTVVVGEPRAGPARRTWPTGLSAAEVRLVERWFAQAPAMDPARRRELAALLVERLARANPELALPPGLDPVSHLLALFPEAS